VNYKIIKLENNFVSLDLLLDNRRIASEETEKDREGWRQYVVTEMSQKGLQYKA